VRAALAQRRGIVGVEMTQALGDVVARPARIASATSPDSNASGTEPASTGRAIQ
jgi:hypothetical protein